MQLSSPSPIGRGTAECEALSSYVQRLAVGNGTYPGQLVHRMFAWLRQKTPVHIGHWAARPQAFYLGRNINAFGLADTWLAALQQAVPNERLTWLGANHWARAFPARGVLKANLSWCAECLASDPVPYHRLLWQLQPSRHCLKHGTPLSTSCPQCHRPPPVLHERSHVEICPWCSADLRAAPSSAESHAITSEAELGEIISHFSNIDEPATWTSCGGIRALAQSRGIGNSSHLARAIGTSKLTTRGWWQGTNRVSLPLAMHAYSRLQTSFSAAVTGRGLRILPPGAESRQTVIHLRGRRTPRAIDWASIKNHLRDVSQRPLSEAPTLLAVAEKLDIERRTLRAHFPSLCRSVAKRRRQSEEMKRQNRDQELTGQLKHAVSVIQAAHEFPQQKRIEELLERPGLFHSHYARNLLRDLLADLDRAAASA